MGATIKGKGKAVPAAVTEWLGACKAVGVSVEDSEVQSISAQLGKCETSVRLVNVTLGPPITKALTRFFQKYTKIQSIAFYGCIGADESFLRQLAVDFPKSGATSLSFDFMAIGREFCGSLLSLPTLESLSLRGNPVFGVPDQAERFPFTLNIFLNSLMTASIRSLNLYGCGLRDAGAIALAGSLYFNTSVTCLNVAKNGIGDSGAVALAEALSCHALTDRELDILEQLLKEEARSRVTDEGGQLTVKKKGAKGSFAKPVPKKVPAKVSAGKKAGTKPPPAKIANFDPAAPVTPQMLARWNQVVVLETGVKALIGNQALTTLIVDENDFGPTGLDAFGRMLAYNKRIVGFSCDTGVPGRDLRRTPPAFEVPVK